MTKDITRLKRSLEGDVLYSAFDRGRYATDASIYQMMPLAVITPRSARDIKTTIEFAQARKLSILPGWNLAKWANREQGFGVG